MVGTVHQRAVLRAFDLFSFFFGFTLAFDVSAVPALVLCHGWFLTFSEIVTL